MELLDAIRTALKELVLPELDGIKGRLTEVQAKVDGHTEALRVLNSHLLDQSRRIDAINERIDGLANRLDVLRDRIDAVNNSVSGRIDRLYEVVVRRDEHDQLLRRIEAVENALAELKKQSPPRR